VVDDIRLPDYVTCARSGLRGGTGLGGLGGRQFVAGDEVDVDAHAHASWITCRTIGPPPAMCHQLCWMDPITI
jgi:hypothetical protein